MDIKLSRLRNTNKVQYSFGGDLLRHLEKSVIDIKRLEKQSKRNKDVVIQVFDNHAQLCLMVVKKYNQAFLTEMINYFKIKYEHKEI
jgi:hypothetical protein